MRRLVEQFRLVLVLALAVLVVLVDSVSRMLSMCADLVFIAAIIALCWGPLTRRSKEKPED